MSSVEGANIAYHRKLQLPALELPVAYGFAYDWGSLQVTESAHDAYQLTPLREGILKSPGQLAELPKQNQNDQINMWLVGPDEMEHPGFEGQEGIGAEVCMHKRGVGMQVGFDPGNKALRQAMAEALAELDDTVEDIEVITTEMGKQASADSVKRYQPQIIAHFFSEVAEEGLAKALYLQRQLPERKFTVRLATLYAATGLVSAAVILGLQEVGLTHPTPDAALIAPAVNSIVGLTGAYTVLRHNFLSINNNEDRDRQYAAELAEDVGKDLIETYSIWHFDYQHGRLIEPDEE